MLPDEVLLRMKRCKTPELISCGDGVTVKDAIEALEQALASSTHWYNKFVLLSGKGADAWV